MARFDAAVPPLHASASGRAASTGRLGISRHGRILTRLAVVLLSLLAAALVISETLSDLYAARELHLGQALEQADATASLIAERLDNLAAAAISPKLKEEQKLSDTQRLLAAAVPFRTQPSEMLVGVTDRSGRVVASIGFHREIRSIADLVGRDHVAEANRSSVARVVTPDGVDAIVAIRDLAEPLGQVAIVAPTSRLLSLWRKLARTAAIGSFTILLLTAAFVWQRRHARLAKREGKRIRARMQAAMTDISRNERELLEKEQRLIATLTDLERSRLAVERQSLKLAALADHYLDQRRRAENANRAKAEFLANMSHELRTPLNAIIGFSEIMETGLFGALGSEKYGEYVSDIRRSGQYLLGVVSDILEMARIEAGRRRIKRQTVLLKDLIGEAAVSVAGAAEAKKLTLLVAAPAAQSIEADPRALVKVLVHLARNAIEHTCEGGKVKIMAKLYPSHVGIHIGDTGSGIPKHRLAELGRPFQRVNADMTKTSSGLGFAIARSLVELHGGRLRIRSREGSGTVLVLSLPRQGKRQDEARFDDQVSDESRATGRSILTEGLDRAQAA